MNESTKTKKALRGSLFALFLCIILLIGTTFAWFTDTASTGVNKIQAGNLDVELEYSTDMEQWKTADSKTKLFDESILWEPGVTQVVYLRVKNAGNLALKYTMGMNSSLQSTRGKNVNNEKYYIGDYLKMGAATVNEKLTTREAAWAAVEGNVSTVAEKNPLIDDPQILEAGKTTAPMAVVIYMPTTVGNEANAKSPSWTSALDGLGINLYASQATVENDSFDNSYDADAPIIVTAQSSTYKTYEITKNVQAKGGFGAVQVEGQTVTINADVYAEYSQSNNGKAAMAVNAGHSGKVIIKGGNFRQVGVPKDDPCDLIYATGKATIEINGGTFKAVQPERTLNVLDIDRGNAKIIVKGGSFYKYDPSNPTLGDNEVFVADGYHVEKDGDWYKVVANK